MKAIRKKRIFLSLLCVLILVLCLVSCNDFYLLQVYAPLPTVRNCRIV